MQRHTLLPLIVAVLQGFGATAFAAGETPEILFGSEFTFTSWKLVIGDNGRALFQAERRKILEKYEQFVINYCAETKDCTVLSNAKGYVSIRFHDGLEIATKRDANVIEFKVTPLTRAQLQANEARLQAVIFDGMKKSGAAPSSLLGNGHVSIDKSTAFGNDLLLYRDFIVDFHNHPGIGDGVLEKDPYNARTHALYPERSRETFAAVIQEVDEGKITSIPQFERELYQRVYKGPKGEQLSGVSKGQALYLGYDRIEIRSVRAQASADQFTALTELFERRIAYLRAERAAGRIVAVIEDVGANSALHAFSQFYHYVTETGLPWERFRNLLLPKKYWIFPWPLPKWAAFSKRSACIYWLKKQRADLYHKTARSWRGAPPIKSSR